MADVRTAIRRHAPILLVLVIMLAAFALVLANRWRRGAFVVGVAAVVACALRLVLSDDAAGLLAVRGKAFDVGALAVVGGTILWLAVSIDPLGTD